MSANIYYKQVKPKEAQSLSVGSPSSFTEAMDRAFGSYPWRLDERHVPILKGMAAVDGNNGWDKSPFEQLIEKIEKLDEIEVWPEY